MRPPKDTEIMPSEPARSVKDVVDCEEPDGAGRSMKGRSNRPDLAQREGRINQVTPRATMSLAQAAQVLGIHRTTAWSLYQRGQFPVPVLKVGTRLRVVDAHLRRFLETGEPIVPGALSNRQGD